METRNLDKALDIVSLLLMGNEVSEKGGSAALYQEYNTNGEVYDIVHMALKKMNINLYEYNNCLYAGAGENNRAFGYSNEELRKELGVRNNKELYLAYFVIYNIIMFFYKSSDAGAYADFVRVEEIIAGVDAAVCGIIDKREGIILDEVEENSFRQIALSWDELPAVSSQETSGMRAARNSKAGFVKLVFNFLVRQELFAEAQERYYPRDRFRALATDYFENYKSRLIEIMRENSNDMEDKDAAD